MSHAFTKPVMDLLNRGDRAGALEACGRLAAEQPASAEVASLHAFLLLNESRAEEAIGEARRAVSLNPESAPMRANLARALIYKGTLDQVLAEVDAAKGLAPDWPELYALESEACTHFGYFLEAARREREAVAKFPGNVDLMWDLAIALHSSGQNVEAVEVLNRAIARAPTDLRLLSAAAQFCNYIDTMTPEQVFEAHKRYGRAVTRHYPVTGPVSAAVPQPLPREGRRVRVGIVSPDLREHSVAFFIRALLEHYDRSKIELFAYHTYKRDDAMTGALRGLPEHWRGVQGRTTEEIASSLRADQLDLLIELAGHTKGNVLLPISRRVAAKHATYLGYPNTTGLSSMQFRIVDSHTDPAGSEALATEKLVRIDPCFLCFQPPRDAPEPGLPPSGGSGSITFGSFNTVKKISDTTVRLWSRVLKRVPDSRLLVKSHGLAEPAMREFLRARFEAQGVDGSRVQVMGPVEGTAGHLAVYGQVDIALDTFPYHGTTTTCEALWMGVPVVTLAGDRHASRVGVSLLTNVGAPELIARSPDEFADIAAALAGDGARLARLRRELRGMVESSPLRDGVGFARRFEQAVQEMVGA